jgi:choline dehydrogenase-like flavoprotein
MTPFVVAGAGLGGALLGALLGRAGHRVLLLERRPDPRRAGADGISAGVRASASAATGMLTKKTHDHDAHSVMTPPRNTPAVPPAGAAAP